MASASSVAARLRPVASSVTAWIRALASSSAFCRRVCAASLARRNPAAIPEPRPAKEPPRAAQIDTNCSPPPDLVAVGALPQAQAPGRRRLAGLGAVAGPDDRRQVPRPLATKAHVDDGADDRAHHLVAEGVGRDLEPQ